MLKSMINRFLQISTVTHFKKCFESIVIIHLFEIHRKLEREKDRISLAVSVISKLGGMPTSTQIANWAFEEADETMVNFCILFRIKKKTNYSSSKFLSASSLIERLFMHH